MVRRGKGWLLVGSSVSEQLAKAKAAELNPKGYETSINKAVIKSYRGKPDRTVFKVWAKDTLSWRHSYKKNGEGPRRY